MATWVEKLQSTLLPKLQRVSDFERWLDLRAFVYRGDPADESSPKRVPLGPCFPTLNALCEAVQAGDPAALEAALLLLGRATPSTVEEEALVALAEGWPHFRDTALRVLGACKTERSFRALLGAFSSEVVIAGYELRNNAYEQGARLVFEMLSTHPTVSPIPAVADLDAAYTQGQRMEGEALLRFFGTSPSDAILQKKSIELLRRVYAEHPERYLRMAAGHALCERGDEQSLQLLVSLEKKANDKWGRLFAVKALMQQDPSTAFRRLESRLDDIDVSTDVIRILLSSAEAARKADPDKGWVPEDAGWLGWLVSIRKSRQHWWQGAQGILAAYKGQLPAPTKGKSKAKPRSAVKAAQAGVNPAVSAAVALYLQTPGPTAWRGLRKAVGKGGLDAETSKAALPAVQRFVDQALLNLQRIHTELKGAGYRFVAKRPIVLANKDANKQLKRLEKAVGPLPLTLRVWLLTIGAVDLRGQLDEWGTCHTDFLIRGERNEVVRTDPLVVCSLGEAFDELDGCDEAQAFEFPLGPDADGKAGFSAGDERLLVDGATLDATLVGAPKGLVFSDFLRHSLKHAGFPGLASRAAKDPLLRRLMRELSQL